ncbi:MULTISPECIES: non-ribosomal peptide synthetase [Streptomyces]|uniref:Amino acid adenylation domain-containing protein n=1 Tax=Streptomyces griseocarneus TaxID=51201 RepID=A0ABX7RNK3_9ACTN|nr:MULTISPECIES: non-ribosomal peptide synthetase [Streptomyces]QSY49372.1 amino acid adenylation domain-containing protein [Streptomyces griseocarneus]
MSPALPSLPEALAEQTLRTPDATAIRHQDGTLTYRELADHVTRCASVLHDRGVRPGDVVALQAPRGAPAVLALLGILAAGAAYLPLDPAEPAARASGLFADSGVALAVVDTAACDPPPTAGGITVVPLTELLSAPAASGPPPGPADAGQPAYVMCTSGTTGRPKAVSVPHHGVVRLVRDQWYARFGPDHTVLLHSPLSFDASVFEIFAALLNGGQLVIAPPGRMSPADLGKVLRHYAVTTLYLTASLFRLVVDEEPAALDGVRLLFTGGEAASAEHLERVRRQLPGCRLVNLYGPTENTVSSTMYPIDPHSPVPSPVPIGLPVDGAEVHIMGEDGRPVPDGGTGELWLGGVGLAHGYLGTAGQDASRFVPHFDGVPGHRLYRSGDLGHRRADGDIVFEGRIDDQIKIEGHRVEPGEIEHALRRHPAVADAFVHARRSPGAGQRLVAYLVPRTGAAAPLDARTAREHLAGLLPAYLVPGQYVVLERLPLKENGKVDRTRLPAPEASRAAPERLSPTERQVAGVWCEVLRLDTVGPRDDFFARGGTSIGASRVVARIRGRLGVELPLAVMFDTPTLAEVARAVDAAAGRPAPSPPPAAPRPSAGFTVELSAQQRARLNANRAAADGRTQPVLIVHRLTGPLDVTALRLALDALVARHDILATRYPLVAEPVGVVAPADARHWPLEVRLRPRERHDAEVDALHAEQGFGRRPFDLADGPVVRGLLITDGDRDHLLGLAVDHIAFDELSAELLTTELAALYGEARGTAPAGLGPVTQYQTYARMRAERYAGPEGRAAVDRAVDELRTNGFRPPLPLPAHPGHDPRATGATRTLERDLPAIPAPAADRLAAQGITPNGLHLCVLARAVSAFAVQERFGFQISQSGRHLPGTDTTIGCLTELAFVHFERTWCADLAELCEKTRRQLVRLATDPPPLAAALAHLRADGHRQEVERLRDRPYLLFHHRQETPVTPFAPDVSLTPLLRPAPRTGARRDPALTVTTRSGPGGGKITVEYVEAAYPREFVADLTDAAADALTDLTTWAGSR